MFWLCRWNPTRRKWNDVRLLCLGPCATLRSNQLTDQRGQAGARLRCPFAHDVHVEGIFRVVPCRPGHPHREFAPELLCQSLQLLSGPRWQVVQPRDGKLDQFHDAWGHASRPWPSRWSCHGWVGSTTKHCTNKPINHHYMQ